MLTDEMVRQRLHRLGAALVEEAGRAPAAAPPVLVALDAPPPRRPAPRRWLAAAAVVVVLAVAGAWWRVADDGDRTHVTTDPTSDPAPTTHPAETTVTTLAPTDPRPVVGGAWLRPGGTVSDADPLPGGTATSIDPAALPGWSDVLVALGADDGTATTTRLPSGAVHVGLARDGVAVALLAQRLDGPMILPVARDLFAAGFVATPDHERYVGAADDGATLAQVVAPDGRSTTLSVDAPPDEAAALLGDLDEVAVAVHGLVGAW